jgi:hypothetical protein
MSSCLSRMTSGEKRFAQRLEAKLEEDYLCWYDVPVGPANVTRISSSCTRNAA